MDRQTFSLKYCYEKREKTVIWHNVFVQGLFVGGKLYHNEISQNFFHTEIQPTVSNSSQLVSQIWRVRISDYSQSHSVKHFRRKCNICIIKLCSKSIYSSLLFLKTFHITNVGGKWYHSKAQKGILKESVYVNQIHFKVMCKNKLLLMEIVLFLELYVPITH